jgi:galactarate dehydratase
MNLNKSKKRYVKANDNDNVVIIVDADGIQKGVEIVDGIKSCEFVPQSHKMSLVALKNGDKIIRYGEVIGYANEDIPVGSWITEDKVSLPKAPLLEEIPLPEEKTENPTSFSKRTFMGYKNSDGTVGTKNMLGIITCSQCVEGVLNLAIKKIKKDLLPKYRNIDGVMAINHNYGCGVAINAPEAIIPIRTLQNLSTHPNFGNQAMVIALGCEKLEPKRLMNNVREDQLIVLQEESGFDEMIDSIYKKAENILVKLDKRKRTECSISELVVGLQCGGSDSLSGVTANPAIGYAADLLVEAGATVMFSEVTEVRDGVHHLIPRTVNSHVATKLKKEMSWYDNYLELGKIDRDANPTPGNKKGGLANIVEKSLGSIAKSGTSPIVDVLAPGEKIRKRGLNFAATPASDFVCGSLQLASGMTIEVFSTGRGTTYGLAMAPVIKVSSRTELKKKWGSLIDIDAGIIATGENTIQGIGKEIFEMIIRVAGGEEITGADESGIENAICLFNPAPIT